MCIYISKFVYIQIEIFVSSDCNDRLLFLVYEISCLGGLDSSYVLMSRYLDISYIGSPVSGCTN